MNISIIIPNYNGARLLEKNLPKIIASTASYKNGSVEIIVADDASEDNSLAIVDSIFSKKKQKHLVTKIIKNTDSKIRGFSKNVNRAVRSASGEILILLNSDVNPHSGFYKPLLAHFTNGSVFAVGCLDESKENGKIVYRGRGIGHWEKGFLFHSKGSVEKANTLWVTGGSGAFRKSIWDSLGGLYDIYDPFYWEDIDLSYRAQKKGYTVFFEKESRVVHEHTKGAIQTHFSKSSVQTIAYRNQFLFIWINATDISIILEHILRIPLFVLSAIRDKNSAAFIGLCKALFLLPNALVLRGKNTHNLKKTDKELQIFS